MIPDGDRDHRATAAGAWALAWALVWALAWALVWARSGRCGHHGFLRHVGSQHRLAGRQAGGALAVGEEAVMADAVKAVRQGMQQEAPDELVGIERHAFLLAAMAMVTPAECDFAVFHADEPGIGDGDAVGIARKVDQHLLRSAEGWLSILPIIRQTARRFAILIILSMGRAFLSCAWKTPAETGIFV